MSNFDKSRLNERRKIFTGSVAGGLSKGDPKMDDTRRVTEAAYVGSGAANSTRRNDASGSPYSDWPNIQKKRVLSLDSVMDDVRAILCSDRRDHEPTNIEVVATASPPK